MAESQLIAKIEEKRYFVYDGTFQYARKSFNNAGQDSWTQPPAQSDDLFEGLTNIMPVTQGNLTRRWGYSLFSGAAATNQSTIGRAYSYRNETQNQREIVVTSTGNISAVTEAGQSFNSNIYNPTSTSLTPRAINSRDYMYLLNGAQADLKKWNGAQSGGTTNWGIDINDVAGTLAGPNGGSAANDLGSVPSTQPGNQSQTPGSETDGGGGDDNWTFPGGTPQVTLSPLSSSSILLSENFNFNIPSNATITGIAVALLPSGGGGNNVFDAGIYLLKAGQISGADQSNLNSWNSATRNYGSTTNLWDSTWTPADINGSSFGLSLQIKNTSSSDLTSIEVSSVTITVYYTITTTGVGTWSNVGNAIANDGAVASTNSTVSPSSYLQVTGFNFAVPTNNSILGIQVDIKASVSGGTANLQPVLAKNGVAYGTQKTTSLSNTSLAFITFGGPADPWTTGLSGWTPADINSSGFGVQFATSTVSGSTTLNVDYVRITIYSGAGPITLGSPTSGAITLNIGRKYSIVFENSSTGGLSNLTPFTASTGVLTTQEQPLNGIPASLDPQVDKKIILATADGGDETLLYFLAEIDNATTTYTDNTPETTLLTQNVFQSSDDQGAEHGVADNIPPPAITLCTKHKGRLFGAVGRTVYFSKNIDDLTTSTATIAGRYEECWPASNQFDVSELAETVSGFLSTGDTLYISTERHIRVLSGDSPSNFNSPQIVFAEAGVLNQECWNLVFIEGQPSGSMWLTPDYRVIFSDFNTYRDVGTPIQDILNSINPSVAATACHATFVNDGEFDLWILSVPTGANTLPNTQLVYDMRHKMWFVWQPTDTFSASLFNVASGGIPQWIFGTGTGKLYQYSSSVTQDRFGDTPISYTATIISSWLDMGDPTLRKVLNEMEVVTSDTGIKVTVEGATKQTDFTNPTAILTNASLVTGPFGEIKLYLAASNTAFKWYRFTFTSTSNIAGVLGGYNIEAIPFHRV